MTGKTINRTSPGVDKVKPNGWVKNSLWNMDLFRNSVGLLHCPLHDDLIHTGDLQLGFPFPYFIVSHSNIGTLGLG